jgi:serine phosphatase RsbU (regulator of sigma subunit)
LAIVKTNAERHGGRIRVSSEVGKGSTFTLELPIDARNVGTAIISDASPVVVTESIKPAQPQPTAPIASPAVEPKPSAPGPGVFTRTTTGEIPVVNQFPPPTAQPGGGREALIVDSPSVATPESAVRGGQGELIWVIDDEPVNIEVIRARLEMHNYRVLGLPSAVMALEELSRAPQLPDLILLDIIMPLMSGFEFCERLKHRPEWVSIPIIMVSAKSQLVDKIYGLNLGAIDYMTKPFQKAELLSKIRTFLDLRVGQRMRAELEMASAIQSMLISGERFRGTSCEWAGRVTACTETGGDWFGVLDHPGSTVTTSIVADVSGHGAPAALVTGLLHGFFSATRRQLTEPDPTVWKVQVEDALKALNQTILSSTHRKLVQSMLLWSFDHKTRKARFVNAGHPHPIILRGQANGPPHVETLLSPPSSLLGDVEDPKFSWGEAQFSPTDCFVVYTDGLVECTNVTSKPYGAKRVHQVLQRSAKLSAEQLRDILLEDASLFYGSTPRSDDVTVLVGRVL